MEHSPGRGARGSRPGRLGQARGELPGASENRWRRVVEARNRGLADGDWKREPFLWEQRVSKRRLRPVIPGSRIAVHKVG